MIKKPENLVSVWKEKSENIKRELNEKYRLCRKSTAIIFIIYLIAFSALIRADFLYIDDLGRAAWGYRGWEDFSRYISNLGAYFIHASGYLTDVSPMTQFLAAFEMAVAGVIIITTFSDKKKISIWNILAVLPVALCPYFLQCISYKFDSPYMALSVLASVVPFLFLACGIKTYVILSIAGILTMCMTYQAASGIYPMVVLFLCFQNWNQKVSLKENLKFTAASFISYVTGIVAFKFLFMKPADSYVSNQILPLRELITGSLRHYYNYYANLYLDFKKIWLIMIAFTILGFCCVSVQKTRQKKVHALIASLFVIGMSGTLVFGLYPFLKNPLFSPRAMYGLGIFIALLAIQVSNTERAHLWKMIYGLLTWCFFVFALTYGNALAQQKAYADFRIQMVVKDLSELDIMTEEPRNKKIQLYGSIGLAPANAHMPQNYRMLNRLVPVIFAENWVWSGRRFSDYYGLRDIDMILKDDMDFGEMSLPVLCDTTYHCIRGEGEYILIELK